MNKIFAFTIFLSLSLSVIASDESLIALPANNLPPEKSLNQDVKLMDVNAKPKNKILFGLYYNFAEEMTSDDYSVVSGNQKLNGSASTEFEKGMGLSFGYLWTEVFRKVDFELGAFYDLPRGAKESTRSLNGTELTSPAYKSQRVSGYGIYYNIIYKTNETTYALVGINLHSQVITGGSSSALATPARSSKDTGFGGQIGLGHRLSEKLALEAQYRRLVYSQHVWAEDNSYSEVINNAKIDGLIVSLKFEF